MRYCQLSRIQCQYEIWVCQLLYFEWPTVAYILTFVLAFCPAISLASFWWFGVQVRARSTASGESEGVKAGVSEWVRVGVAPLSKNLETHTWQVGEKKRPFELIPANIWIRLHWLGLISLDFCRHYRLLGRRSCWEKAWDAPLNLSPHSPESSKWCPLSESFNSRAIWMTPMGYFAVG